MGLAPTTSKPPSCLRTVGSATRPSAHSWRKIKDPLACTASVTFCKSGYPTTARDKGVTNWFPSSDLRVAPDTWGVCVSSGLRGDESGLGDDKCSGNACTLFIVGFGKFTVDVALVGAEAR